MNVQISMVLDETQCCLMLEHFICRTSMTVHTHWGGRKLWFPVCLSVHKRVKNGFWCNLWRDGA